MSSLVESATPVGMIKALAPFVIVLIIAIILIVVVFGAKPTIGGLQI